MMGALLASLLLTAPAAFACDIALMLAVDVSGSVDGREYRIQMDGLAAALTDRSVMSALVASQAQIALMQWTGTGRQTVVINWTKITNTDDVHAFAFEVATVPRIWRDFSTAIGEAMALAVPYFAIVDDCDRLVIDISGDGISNEGQAPHAVWPDLEAAGVTVNAMVIQDTGFDLTEWFESHVITGPGAFAVTANSFDEYPEQIIRKLYRELTTPLSMGPISSGSTGELP
jgi:Ca-activated chloride channel family protein